MPDVLLSTLNAKYAHCAFGLRYLHANMGELAQRTDIAEFTINDNPLDIAESILSRNPRILGLGVYIWNAFETHRLVSILKQLNKRLTIVLGGPEVSHEAESQPLCQLADYVVQGEADLAFAQLCTHLLDGKAPQPAPTEVEHKFIKAELPPINAIQLPYHLYSDHDIAHRVIYVEASRGCPFRCEFCLSSLDVAVRSFDQPALFAALRDLLDRGARRFKFVDRTFNLSAKQSAAILEFFLPWKDDGLFLHFEVIPDRLPDALKHLLSQFAPGTLQLEVGVQTFNEEVAERISRRQNNDNAEANLRFLREQTGAHVHTDLIAGLPGETLASFAAGFDRLLKLNPQEVQIEILKRLRGTPIVRHDMMYQLKFDPHPPYELISSSTFSHETLQQLRRLSRYWDMLGNSGRWKLTLPTLLADAPFERFTAFTQWLYNQTGRAHSIDAKAVGQHLLNFLVNEQHHAPADIAATLWNDMKRWGLRDCPEFLREHVPQDQWKQPLRTPDRSIPPRQRLHLG